MSLNIQYQKPLALLTLLFFAVAIFWSGQSRASKAEQTEIASWDLTVSQLYGKQLQDFAPLGPEGLYFDWVLPEETEAYCTFSSTCQMIRLANVISCEHGFSVSYNILGAKDVKLSTQWSRRMFVPIGQFVMMEIDNVDVPEGGSIYLLGAKCQAASPAE